MLPRLLKYGQKIFGLLDRLDHLRDNRLKPEIPARVFPRAILILWLGRFASLNSLDQFRPQSSLRRFLRHNMPCADQIGNVSEIMDIPGLRNILGQMYKRLVRNKVLQPMRGHRLAVVDGHEINSSYKRCCEQCLQRRITINGEEQIQYYHRAVIFMLIGPACFFLLDFELLNPGDDEGTAAMRLIDRVLKHYPRSFDILLGDGLYPQARIFKKLRQHGKHAIVVLKDERRDLMKDSRSLFKSTPTLKYQEKSILYQCWDIENLDSWDSYDEKVRLLRTLETKIIRKKHGHRKMKEEQTTEWVWITTLPASVVPAKNVVCFGHERWRIENEGFNELNNHWNAKHYFHHHPVSIQAFWLILFIAHTLFHCFMRNLKPALRYGHSLLHWADLIRAEFITNKWAFSTA